MVAYHAPCVPCVVQNVPADGATARRDLPLQNVPADVERLRVKVSHFAFCHPPPEGSSVRLGFWGLHLFFLSLIWLLYFLFFLLCFSVPNNGTVAQAKKATYRTKLPVIYNWDYYIRLLLISFHYVGSTFRFRDSLYSFSFFPRWCSFSLSPSRAFFRFLLFLIFACWSCRAEGVRGYYFACADFFLSSPREAYLPCAILAETIMCYRVMSPEYLLRRFFFFRSFLSSNPSF